MSRTLHSSKRYHFNVFSYDALNTLKLTCILNKLLSSVVVVLLIKVVVDEVVDTVVVVVVLTAVVVDLAVVVVVDLVVYLNKIIFIFGRNAKL